MGRLIDADIFKTQASAMAVKFGWDSNKALSFLKIIDAQPTAYEVEKVVEQISEYLNGYKICKDYDEEFFMCLEEYITNIVKGGIYEN